jgi:hypothetical protein
MQPCEAPGAGVCIDHTCYEEICTDGNDNDGDTDVDCADQYCVDHGFACVPQPPAGWNGPVVLGFDNPANPTLNCLDHSGWTSATAAFTDLLAEPAVCAACGCAPATASCGGGARVTFATDQCVGGLCAHTVLTLPPTGACTALNANCGSKILAIRAEEGMGTLTCSPTGGGVQTMPTAQWQRHFVACYQSQGSTCSGTQDCAAPPPIGNEWSDAHCIWWDGIPSGGCPASFPEGPLVARTGPGLNDTRDCSGCSCTAISAGCDGSVYLYTQSGCPVVAQNYDVSEVWTGCGGDMGTYPSVWGKYAPSTPTTWTCPSTGGQPTGDVVPQAPAITVCCDAPPY